MRYVLAITASLLISAAAPAQQVSVRWSQQVEPSIALAQQAHRPIMFYLVDRTRHTWRDTRRHVNRTFRDPDVAVASRRFVCIELDTQRYASQIEKWGLPPRSRFMVVITTPTGELLRQGGIGNPDSFCELMESGLDAYRDWILEIELRPQIEDEKTTPAQLRPILDCIESLQLTKADKLVIGLLDRDDLERKDVLHILTVLGKLSTRSAVDKLLELAATDDGAAEALLLCHPVGAEQMLDHVGGIDRRMHLITYRAAARICRLPDPRPDRFWDTANGRTQRKEIRRLREAVTDAATQWRRQNSP